MSSVATLKEREEGKLSVIGTRIPKYDAVKKVTGRADYLIDLKLPGMLYGKILRSRYPHAKILKIDTSRALSLPGVVAVMTAADTPRIRFGFMKDNLPLKEGKVLSLRDEVAAVAAVDPATASRAVELIDVDYEQLPAVFDPVEAMAQGAPQLHEESENNVVNLLFRFRHGDPQDAASRVDAVSVEETFRLNFITHSALGTMGVLASFGPDDVLTMWANTQAPFMYQRELAEAVGLPPEKVRVIQPYIGGSFGRGMDVYPIDCIAALLSMKTGRPVKILLSREEDLSYSPTRQPAIIKIKTSANRDGKLLARRVEVDPETGKVTVLKVVAAHDAGRILNPVGAEGQIEGGVAMGVGFTLAEQLVVEDGAVVNPSFADCKLLTIGEAPEIKVMFVGEPDPEGPFGAKGLGEHGCISISAAIANAVYDALGARLFELPLLPEKVLKATKSRS